MCACECVSAIVREKSKKMLPSIINVVQEEVIIFHLQSKANKGVALNNVIFNLLFLCPFLF
jgi:hypothetical protein